MTLSLPRSKSPRRISTIPEVSGVHRAIEPMALTAARLSATSMSDTYSVSYREAGEGLAPAVDATGCPAGPNNVRPSPTHLGDDV